MHIRVIIALLVALFALLCYACMSGTSTTVAGGWTVYGSHGCSWTHKQLEEMDAKKISYKFVDCTKEKCDGIAAFPTLKNDDGTVKVGYTPM